MSVYENCEAINIVLDRSGDFKRILRMSEGLYVDAIRDVFNGVKINLIFSYEEYSKSKGPLVFLGYIPKWADKVKDRSSCHLVIDKYFVQSFSCDVPVNSYVLKKCLSLMYRRYTPDIIIVNNEAMACDFREFFYKKNSYVKIFDMPHPLSKFILGTKMMSRKVKQRELGGAGCLLSDSTFIVAESLADKESVFNRLIKSIRFDDQVSIAKGLANNRFVGLFNYRPGSYSTFNDDKNLTLKKLRKCFVWIFIPKIINFIKYKVLRLNSSTDRNLKYPAYNTFNARWKPSTKLGSSIAYELPLVTMPEASYDLYKKKLGVDVYNFSTMTELESTVNFLNSETKMVDYELAKQRLLGAIRLTLLKVRSHLLASSNS